MTQQDSTKRTPITGFILLVLGAAAFVLFNNLWHFSTPSRALDGSWAYVLHALAGKAHFGSELVFTYGPLGFLIAHGDTPEDEHLLALGHRRFYRGAERTTL